MNKRLGNICYSKRENSNLKNGECVGVALLGDPQRNEIKKFKRNSAITLIALVITIIVLLILAGLTLIFVLGENGLFGKARQAKIETDKAQAIEDIKLKILEVQADAAQEGRTATLEDLYNKLKEIEQEYEVTQKTGSSATLTSESISEWSSSITALNIRNTKYDYVVEVGNNLQIKNDVQTASNSGNILVENSVNQTNGTSGQVTIDGNEKEIGTFFGEKLYEKSYKMDNISNGAIIDSTLNNSNIIIRNIDGTFTDSVNYFNIAYGNSAWFSTIVLGSENLSFFENTPSTSTLSNFSLTIQYTKK